MSRRKKKQKQKQKQRRQAAIKKKAASSNEPLKFNAMEQALQAALRSGNEDVTEKKSKSFSSSLKNIGKRIFRRSGSIDAPLRKPRPRGADTQFLKRSGADDIELVIGLDFGTSCTKVVIQDVAKRIAYAVPFASDMSSTGSYLLPTIVNLDDRENYNLDGRGDEYRGLKENLMNIAAADPASHDAKHETLMPHTIAYLALMFREVRAWFMEKHENDYQGRKILWRTNVGLPASRFDQPDMPLRYRKTIRRAWYLSTISDSISADQVSKVRGMDKLPSDSPDSLLSPEAIAAFPEVVAAVQGYAKSPERKEGIHLLVDVGASTLDVTCFRLLSQDHEDSYPIFFASVRRLGGFELFRHRAEFVQKSIKLDIDQYSQKMDGVTEPENPLKLKFELVDEEQLAADSTFGNAVGEAIWQVIAESKNKKDPRAQEWTSTLPTFLCGGASSIDIYAQALRRIDENTAWSGRLSRKELTLPRNVQAPEIVPALRQRLMVAYGLSFTRFDYGNLIPPSGIPEPGMTESKRQFTKSFISKDMV